MFPVHERPMRNRLKTAVTGTVLTVAAALTASCSGDAPATLATGERQRPATPAPTITISPAEGSTKVRPDKKIVVKAQGGTLQEVTVTVGGKTVPGRFNADRTLWRSTDLLKPASRYTVVAKASGAGGSATATSRFTTLKPKYGLAVADVTPSIKGEVLGVGAPIIVTFNQPVADKAAVERALHVEPEKPVPGAWRWVADNKVIYRTARFWPAHQKVRFFADLEGVKAGPQTYGVKNHQATLTIGAAWISKVDTRTKTMVVRKDGKVVRRMKISAGKATTREYTTTSGIHLTMERGNPVRMISPGRDKDDPEYYDLLVPYAVRISNSGEYVHAKDNLWAQGRVNVSHGCINASPADAKWFYENFHRGDVVEIVGTDRPLEWNNGWGFWQLSFKEWKKGSALHGSAA